MHDDPKTRYNPDAWRGKRTPEDIHQARAGYYGSIHHIDTQIGRMIHFLKKNKLWHNTMIIFTSDHGDMLGDHHLWRKTYAYEGSAHVPMIVKPADSMGLNVRERVDAPVVLQDIMPTILDAVGAEIPDTVDGRSMLPLMTEPKPQWRDYIHGEHSTCYSEEQEMQYVTDGRMKYIWFPRLGTEQLFDLEKDRYETKDVAKDPDYAEQLSLWRGRLIAELEPRNCGLTDGDRLVCQAGKPPIVSPHYRERIERAQG
jgi:arylsulfatase A-like enzyme